MKKYIAILLMIFSGLTVASCGHDEPVDPNEITRVQDGNGKVFLEDGQLVDANLDYTQLELEQALKQHEWVREYCFYYDNHSISEKREISAMPTEMHPDGTIMFDFAVTQARAWEYTVSGKKITTTMPFNPISSAYYDPITLIAVSLDLNDSTGRIVMDRKINSEVEGFSASSLNVRMVWRALPASE